MWGLDRLLLAKTVSCPSERYWEKVFISLAHHCILGKLSFASMIKNLEVNNQIVWISLKFQWPSQEPGAETFYFTRAVVSRSGPI